MVGVVLFSSRRFPNIINSFPFPKLSYSRVLKKCTVYFIHDVKLWPQTTFFVSLVFNSIQNLQLICLQPKAPQTPKFETEDSWEAIVKKQQNITGAKSNNAVTKDSLDGSFSKR